MLKRIIAILTLAVFTSTNAGIIVTTEQDIILPPDKANQDYIFVNRDIGEETVRPANWQEWYENNTLAQKKPENTPTQMSPKTQQMLAGIIVIGILAVLLRNYKPKNKCYGRRKWCR